MHMHTESMCVPFVYVYFQHISVCMRKITVNKCRRHARIHTHTYTDCSCCCIIVVQHHNRCATSAGAAYDLRTYIQTYIHTFIHTYIHTDTHTQSNFCSLHIAAPTLLLLHMTSIHTYIHTHKTISAHRISLSHHCCCCI